jgi:uncharacterized protein (TIGR03067 family)
MLRTLIISAVAPVLMLLPVARLRADDAKGQDKDLQGTWELVKAVHDGQDAPPPEKGEHSAIIEGDTLTLKMGDEVHKCTITVDASKTPHTMDVVLLDGDDKGKTIKILYEIKGDELHVCHGKPDSDRPTELSAKEGSGLSLITLKRVKK